MRNEKEFEKVVNEHRSTIYSICYMYVPSPSAVDDFRFRVLLQPSNSHRAEEGKMAAAQSERDPPSALCSEFLNFSAKDTASVSGSSSCRSHRLPPVLSLRHTHLLPVELHVQWSLCLQPDLFFSPA